MYSLPSIIEPYSRHDDLFSWKKWKTIDINVQDPWYDTTIDSSDRTC